MLLFLSFLLLFSILFLVRNFSDLRAGQEDGDRYIKDITVLRI